MALNGIGIASYNGFVWGPAAHTTELRITPVDDRAKRTTSHYVVNITIKTHLVGRPADENVTDAVRKLGAKAGTLVYANRGAGVFRINGPGGNADLIWGPHIRDISLRLLGGGNTTELTWSASFATMLCADAVFDASQPMEFVYSLDIDVDYAGLTKRTYKAYLRIAQTRRFQKDRTIRVTADQFREQATPALLPEFRRTTPASVNVSEDKCELRLTCVDEEFAGNVYPPGVVSAEASHSIASEPGKLFTWLATLRGSFELAKGTPVAVAREFFLNNMLKARIDEFKRNPTVAIAGAASGILAGAVAAGGPSITERTAVKAMLGISGLFLPPSGAKMASDITGPAIIPWSFTFTEPQIFGRTIVEIVAQYKIVSATRNMILLASGLWQPLKGTDWRRWSASVAVHQGPRGFARLVLNPGDDKILDNCLRGGALVALGGGGGNFNNLGGFAGAAFGGIKPPAPIAPLSEVSLSGSTKSVFPNVEAGKSWLDYSMSAKAEQDSGVVIGKTLPTSDLPVTSRSRRPAGGSLETNPFGQTFAQRRTLPTNYVILSGYGIRAGYPVPQPALAEINGTVPVECNRSDMGEGFEQVTIGQCGVPIYYARWKLRYAVLDNLSDGKVLAPPNPVMEE